MTAKQKWAVVARSTFDYVQYPWWAFLSAISQAENSEAGHMARAGELTENASEQRSPMAQSRILRRAILLPSLLHQDPRFYQSSEGGFTRRAWYGVSRILVTRSDSGRHAV